MGKRFVLGFILLLLNGLAFFAVPGALARDSEPQPIRTHDTKPATEAVGDTVKTVELRAKEQHGLPAHKAGADTALAAIIRGASRVRLQLESAVSYEGRRARTDTLGITFADRELIGLDFPWREIATIEVSRGDRRWLGAGIGAVIGLGLGLFVASPTLDEQGTLDGATLEGLQLATTVVSAALIGFIGYELGGQDRRWEAVYP
jgi:hypothetical protein